MSDIISFQGYKHKKNAGQLTAILNFAQEALDSWISNNPRVYREVFIKHAELLREVYEVSRLPMPRWCEDVPPVSIHPGSINVPYQDYVRMKRVLELVDKKISPLI